MKIPKRLTALAILALIGAAISLFQTYHFFEVRYGMAGFSSFCSFDLGKISFNCHLIESSSYAELLPGFPLSGFAAGWFIGLFVISFMARSLTWRRESLRAALAFTAVGVVFGAFYLFIMTAILKTLCVLCLLVDGINLASIVLIVSLKPETFRKLKSGSKKWKTFGGIGIAALLIGFIFGVAFNANGPSGSEIKEAIQAVLDSPVFAIKTDPTSPFIGPKDAPITIVKFSDFQCPHCQRAAETLHPILLRYPHEIRFIFKNFPLDSSCNRAVTRAMHPAACEAARVAWCAHQQGKFTLAYQTLFEKQEELKPGHIIELLPSGLDHQKLDVCSQSSEAKQAVAQDIEEGIALKVESTPTFFINGHRREGGLPTHGWTQLVERLLRESK